MNPSLFISFIVFILGLSAGSFLNCVIYRLEENKSFLKGRSFCPYCKHLLSWKDLIPVLSFIFLRRKCRYCGAKISFQYPLVELGTGLLFLLVFWRSGFRLDLTFGFLILISCFLIIVFVYDWKHYIIPDKIIYSLIGITFLYRFLGMKRLVGYSELGIKNFILSAFLAAGFFLTLVLISKGKWMGMGDVKLAFFMGLFLGFPLVLGALFFSFLIGALVGIGLILLKKKSFKAEIPFGPFLVLGVLIALFFAKEVINWYVSTYICAFGLCNF